MSAVPASGGIAKEFFDHARIGAIDFVQNVARVLAEEVIGR